MPTTPAALANWAGNVTFAATAVHHPGSLEELRARVAGSKRIRALGSAHSFSLVADTDGELVVLDALPPVVEIDSARSSATVAAGMSYAQVARELYRAGFALANMASLPHISVAGSCATGTHGSGVGQRGLAAAVAGLQLVGPEGDLLELRREPGHATFAGAVVALGALGVVTAVTLDIEPTFDVAQHVRVGVALEEVAAGLDDVFGAAYSVSAFTDWASGQAKVWLKRRTDQPAREWAGGAPAPGPVHPVPGMPTELATPQLDVAGPWHERLPHFRSGFTPSAGDEIQSEFLLPRASGPAAITALLGIGRLIAPVLHVSELRTVRADDLWLSPAYGRDCLGFHFTWISDRAAVLPVLRAVEEVLMPLAARPHWGKLTTVPAAEIIARYERAGDFEALMTHLDPAGKFRNAYVDELFPAG